MSCRQQGPSLDVTIKSNYLKMLIFELICNIRSNIYDILKKIERKLIVETLMYHWMSQATWTLSRCHYYSPYILVALKILTSSLVLICKIKHIINDKLKKTDGNFNSIRQMVSLEVIYYNRNPH